jgi:hypothetical protein
MYQQEDTLVSHMVWLHNTMAPLGATPRQYVTLVGAYARIYAAKRKEVSTPGAVSYCIGVDLDCSSLHWYPLLISLPPAPWLESRPDLGADLSQHQPDASTASHLLRAPHASLPPRSLASCSDLEHDQALTSA